MNNCSTNKINLIIFESPVNRFSIAYLMAILEKCGHGPCFNFYYFQDSMSLKSILNSIDNSIPSVFLFSFMTSIIATVIELLNDIKENILQNKTAGRSLIISGGPHVTGDPESAVFMGFDLAFIGECEISWPQFLENIKTNSREILTFKENTILAYNSSVMICGPSPASLDEFQPFGTIYEFVPPLEIMRGCFYNCKFCQTSTIGVKYRSLESIEEFYREYHRRGYKRLCFICPSAFHYRAENPRMVNYAIVEEMLALAKHKYNIKFIEYAIFPSEARPENINDESLKIISKYCSNKRISIGAQSGDREMVLKVGRGHHLDAVYDACAAAYRNKFVPLVDFIFGFPGETENEQLKTLKVIKELHTKFKAKIQTHYFLPLPGTQFYKDRPAPVFPNALELLNKYTAGGLCTNWYYEGLTQSKTVCEILDKFENMRKTKY